MSGHNYPNMIFIDVVRFVSYFHLCPLSPELQIHAQVTAFIEKYHGSPKCFAPDSGRLIK